MTLIIDFVKKYGRLMVEVLLVLLIAFLLWNIPTEQQKENEVTETKTITAEEAEDVNALRNELAISKQNAEILQKRIEKIQDSQREPEVRYEVVYEKGEDITKVVEKKIAECDSMTAPEALEKTDRTVVVQPDPEKTTVNVYKINTYRNWEAGTGFGVHDGAPYIPLSLQRNYDKTHSLALEGQFNINKRQFNGAEVQWKIRF